MATPLAAEPVEHVQTMSCAHRESMDWQGSILTGFQEQPEQCGGATMLAAQQFYLAKENSAAPATGQICAV